MANLPSQDVIATDLRGRILTTIAVHGGQMPDRVAVAWRAYLVGLKEWGVLSEALHRGLLDLLPSTADDVTESLLRKG